MLSETSSNSLKDHKTLFFLTLKVFITLILVLIYISQNRLKYSIKAKNLGKCPFFLSPITVCTDSNLLRQSATGSPDGCDTTVIFQQQQQ